jgi:hypothetical protein
MYFAENFLAVLTQICRYRHLCSKNICEIGFPENRTNVLKVAIDCDHSNEV